VIPNPEKRVVELAAYRPQPQPERIARLRGAYFWTRYGIAMLLLGIAADLVQLARKITPRPIP
jgi:hypothetical protein